MQLPSALIKHKLKKLIKISSKKVVIFSETELSCSNIKKFLIFWEMEVFYSSGNGHPAKIYYIFSKDSFSYILGKRNSEKIPYI